MKISVNFEKVWELDRGGIIRGEVTWMSVLSTGTPTLQSGTQTHVYSYLPEATNFYWRMQVRVAFVNSFLTKAESIIQFLFTLSTKASN